MLAFGIMAGVRSIGSEALLPGLEAGEVVRMEVARGEERVVLVRKSEGSRGEGLWVVASAADAPGDARRIDTALKKLQKLRGVPLEDQSPKQREPLEVQLFGDGGKVLGAAALWTGEGQALPDGKRLQLADMPALPLWPSAWSSLRAPRIDAAAVAAVSRLTPEGPQPLGPDAAVRLAKIFNDLSATGFVAGASISWAGAQQVRVTMTDGSVIDLQQVPDGAGRYLLRMTSDTRADVRDVRRFAFRVVEPLP